MSLPCHSCFDVSPYSAILDSLQQSLLGGKPVTVLCDFLLACCKIVVSCFGFVSKFSCEETSNHSKNDRRHSATGVQRCLSTNYFGNSGRYIVTLYLRALLRPPYRRWQADGARSTPAPICDASGDHSKTDLKSWICGDVSRKGIEVVVQRVPANRRMSVVLILLSHVCDICVDNPTDPRLDGFAIRCPVWAC